MSTKTLEQEAALEKALQELEGSEQPTGGMIAKALGSLAGLFKGAAKPEKGKGKDKLDELLSNYDLDDEDEDGDDDEDGLEEWDGDGDGQDEGDGEEEEAPPARGRKRMAKALEEDDEGLFDHPAMVDVDTFAKALVGHLETQRQQGNDSLVREVKHLRKALGVVVEQNQAMQAKLDEFGTRPAGASGPYTLLRKSASEAGDTISPEVMAKAEAALSKGLISPADRRLLDMASEAGDATIAAHVIAKLP